MERGIKQANSKFELTSLSVFTEDLSLKMQNKSLILTENSFLFASFSSFNFLLSQSLIHSELNRLPQHKYYRHLPPRFCVILLL